MSGEKGLLKPPETSSFKEKDRDLSSVHVPSIYVDYKLQAGLFTVFLLDGHIQP